MTKALKSFQLIQIKPLKIANVPDTHFPLSRQEGGAAVRLSKQGLQVEGTNKVCRLRTRANFEIGSYNVTLKLKDD